MSLDLCKKCVKNGWNFMNVLYMLWYIHVYKIEILEIIFHFSLIFIRVTASKLTYY